jgi:hypothetical protein
MTGAPVDIREGFDLGQQLLPLRLGIDQQARLLMVGSHYQLAVTMGRQFVAYPRRNGQSPLGVHGDGVIAEIH